MELSAREFLADRARRWETLTGSGLPGQLDALARAAVACLQAGAKILAFGNGGSAAQAQHLSGEMTGRFLRDRRPLPAMALPAEASALTGIANDYGYEEIFARQIEAHGRPGDMALGLTTSGRSPNVVAALRQAREMGLTAALLSGGDGGEAAEAADLAVLVPSSETDFIQEAHGAAIHYICHCVEAAFAEGERA
ncbi:MAG: SIS domain-containing protein [bacterium]